jgi:hypothetical protein
MPGWWNVPNNPVQAAVQPITRTPGIADIIPGSYTVPQNPVADYVRGQRKMIGQSGCNCGGSSCNGTINGMAGFSEDWDAAWGKIKSGAVTEAIQVPVLGIPLWGWAAGAVVGLIAISSSGGRRKR